MKNLLLGLTLLISFNTHADSKEVKVQHFGKKGNLIVTCDDRAMKEKYIYNAVEFYYLNPTSVIPEAEREAFVTFLSEDNSRVEHAVSFFETCTVSSTKK
ncbi:MAG: hypothetical protein KC478_12560 [Bacteriovoracaceae bacterium]|nr:hypothetical protein [Bacteriovoracaceae bacterium]